ncbi:hypothetical protein BDN72DRAFT_858361 [Pluteus cervinus]|uniref:Uncharacterized protein n=1 Tax=Pluteus cervinus TaxID=181527 RepID=A0ACD3AS75_9AGAR|nr:hypothetical protein BDN72DRAFT_858361 [Pluteus cervinus]
MSLCPLRRPLRRLSLLDKSRKDGDSIVTAVETEPKLSEKGDSSARLLAANPQNNPLVTDVPSCIKKNPIKIPTKVARSESDNDGICIGSAVYTYTQCLDTELKGCYHSRGEMMDAEVGRLRPSFCGGINGVEGRRGLQFAGSFQDSDDEGRPTKISLLLTSLLTSFSPTLLAPYALSHPITRQLSRTLLPYKIEGLEPTNVRLCRTSSTEFLFYRIRRGPTS